MVDQIASDLPDFTVHDEDHLDALWLLAEKIGGDDVSFNPAEAFVFGVAVLVHDLGLAVAAYPGGLSEVRANLEWRDALGELIRARTGRAPRADELDTPSEGLAIEADRTVLRERHAAQALNLADVQIGDPPRYLVEDEDLRDGFARIAGRLAASHWWPVSDLRQLSNQKLAIAELPADWEVDTLKLACLLRAADYAHLDSRRAPRLRRLLQQPTGESILHWDFQERLARPTVDQTRLLFHSRRPFGRDESDAWWLASDMLTAVDDELKQIDALRRDLGQAPFAVSGVSGVGDPKRLQETVETSGWEPVDARLTVSDVTGLVRRLGGRHLYGDRPLTAVRETIQNAADAIAARAELTADWHAGKVTVASWPASATGLTRVEIRDNGVGMAPELLAGPLLDFGRSLWRDGSLRRLLPGLAATSFQSIGRFGIGFFSVFMSDGPVTIKSRFYLSGAEDTYVLAFPGGLSRRALLRRADEIERLSEPGTMVNFVVDDPDGEFAQNPERQLRQMCPTLEADLEVVKDNGTERLIGAGDWREIAPGDLLRRIGGIATPVETGRVRPLFAADGSMVGRAAAIQGRLYLNRDDPGILTVGGFAAHRAGSLAGVLIGDEPNLARSTGRPTVSPEEFARWATEQAALWAAGPKEGNGIAFAAQIAGYGGNIGDLPICYGADAAMSQIELVHWAAERDLIYLCVELDEDELRMPGGFDPVFEPGPDTIVIDEPIGTSDLGELVTGRRRRNALEGYVYEAIGRAWRKDPKELARSRTTEGEIIGRTEVDDIESYTAMRLERDAD